MSGSLEGQSVRVTGELVIGRENADLTIEDPEVSRRHVAVRLQSGQLEVEDLGSANGTFVNGNRIDGPVKVGGGAKIRVGKTEFEVRGVLPPKGEKHASTQAGASPIAGPQATRATPTPDPERTKAAPIADPQTTTARAIPDPESTRARAIPDPQTTRARAIPDPQTTRARAIPDPQTTKAHAVPDPQVTQARSAPADVAKPQASSQSVLDTSPAVTPAPTAPAPGSSKDVAAQVGAFSPQARRRSRGLASRSWVPTAASFGTAIAAAAALIVYFAVHGVPG